MLDFTIIISFIIASAGIGYFSTDLLPPGSLKGVTNLDALRLVVAVFAALIGGAVGLSFQTSYRRLEAQVKEMPIEVILTRAIGLVIGLLLANLMLAPLFLLPIPADFSFIKPLVAVVGSIILSVTGMNLADTHGRGLLRLINPNTVETLVVEGTLKPANTKVLDTSCIIDGRIELLLETGFLEGLIIVPQFILQELQQVADATKDVKRVRGRRGLEILNRIRENYPERIVINSVEYDDLSTVDTKLVKFAQEINGTLLTNDYNLSKVASVQKVPVLNVNDLVNAVRPSYLPGDNIDIKILKEGKEPSQGIGYLDDGTMVVVEEGSGYVGGEVRVVVTSALQTSAGRMIFAKPQASALA
ncbi:PIN/TRAM domain-containing protein [Cylindrospermopsis curvispora]|uniref:PIN/TRAM domain-containing protein n=2 Tax=Cylindrospermopsis TaxID=77021 RepID=A0A7H0EXZ7_9CYAN|nr:PIN/TRAM domain-containing protein [Cylindrospermopsis curvispora]QNP28663.1 PIN/TRAM domain-containing protein [Cylindrospermopsis curvispora GIHE-G1]BAZ88705.1 PilT domain-containing protein [Raphidiopsis curvata NIES-932]